MYRLFAAIDFPEEVNRRLLAICFGLRGAKWVVDGQVHLTLRFIGEVDGGVFSDIRELFQSIEAEPFELHISELGYFPPRRRPEILWAGVQKNESLLSLRNKIETGLVRIGLPPDGRKFTPHITLARLKETPDEHVARYLAGNSPLQIPPFRVDQFCLYSSFLASEHAIHTLEESYGLVEKGKNET